MSEELIFEVAPRQDTRSAMERRSRALRPLLLLIPAIVLTGAFLLVPLVATIVISLTGWGTHYRDVIADPEVRHALRNSIGWLAFAPLVCLGGLVLARTRRDRRASFPWLLAAPVAASALVSGITFRLVFDPSGARGTVNALLGAVTGTEIPFLGTGWIWVVLSCAFVWQWAGLAIVVFRAVGEPSRDRLRQALVPAGTLALAVMFVVTGRIFDLVVIAAPGSMQDRVDVAGLHWWRAQIGLGSGGTAALAVLTSLVVGGAVLACVWARSHCWFTGDLERPHQNSSWRPPPRGGGRSWAIRLLGVLVAAVWTLPLVVLALTSVHTPSAAAISGWWRGGLGFGSYRQAFDSGELMDALINTAGRALAAAILLVLVAVPAAYALARGDLPRPAGRLLIGAAVALAVIPPQAVILPLGTAFQRLHLLGAHTSLIMVHVAFGIPPAVMLLRNAFIRVPREVVLARQRAPGSTPALLAAAALSWPVVLTVGVLEFILVWNDFVIGLLLGGFEAGQITLVLFEESREFATSSGVLAAEAVVSLVIPLALVLATGRWLLRGLAEGTRR